MATLYTDTPSNFSEIQGVVETNLETILCDFFAYDKVFFYDACSLRYHSTLPDAQCIFDYIKKNNGMVVITSCVMMELASTSHILRQEYIDYIKMMSENGIKLILLREENIYDIMQICVSSSEMICEFLSLAVKCVKNRVSTIEETLESNTALKRNIIYNACVSEKSFKGFFDVVRKNKKQGDNLGEELITICLHILSNLPHGIKKYIVFTDDKGAIGLLKKTMCNVVKHLKSCDFTVVSTARLAQELYHEGIVEDKIVIEQVLNLVAQNNYIRVLCSERFDLEASEKKFTVHELATAIITQHAIRIYS